MASTVHPAPPLHAPPSFSRNSTSTSANGMQLSQSQVDSFNGSQSVASTPAATPPPRQPLQQPVSFGMASNGINNGPMMRPNYGSSGAGAGAGAGAGPHGMPNGYGGYPAQVPQNYRPSIYTAIYSGVSVYEMEVNGVAVMRRRSDSWLNATQILKVAGVDKGKRTKVLEKEILSGHHEKVQGGYGKYQGTWIDYQRGVQFCRQYGVEELLRPLLEYDMGPDGTSLAGQSGIETPTKEQAMAAQRKRLYGTGIDHRPSAQSTSGTFFKNISSAAVNAVNAISKARYESPGRQMDASRRPSTARRPSQQIGSQEAYLPASQQSAISMASQNSFASDGYANPFDGTNGDLVQEPPRKRMRPSSSQEHYAGDVNYDVSMHDATPTEPNESFVYHQQQGLYSNADDVVTGLEPLPHPAGKAGQKKQELLMGLFIDLNQTDFTDHPVFHQISGEDLDTPIDTAANTALHWAATLAQTQLVRALIARGASIFRVNSGGETALLRACVARNNLDKGTFPELLEVLGPTIEIRDGRGRTVLHHIAISSSIKGRQGVGKYYLESLLEFVIRQGSAPSSQNNSFGPGLSSSQSHGPKPISLAKFLGEIVNAQDIAGDTALNLAARINNKGIIQQLLEVKADPFIPNRGGLKPVDFGIGLDGEQEQSGSSQQIIISQNSSGMEKSSISSKIGDSEHEIMSTLRATLADAETEFSEELNQKQEEIHAVHNKIREISAALTEDKRHLEDMQAKVAEKAELEQKIVNLRRSAAEYRSRISQPNGHKASTPKALDNVLVGEADRGLEACPPEVDPTAMMNGNISKLSVARLGQVQLNYLSNLPSAEILRARIRGYRLHNENLEATAKHLKRKAGELEDRYRKIISLCTGVDEDKVDESLGKLLQAVVSEKAEDSHSESDDRIKAFLEMVRNSTAA